MIEKSNNKHENYEILNLIGYGLSKFDNEFIEEFGFVTKKSFFDYCVTIGLVKTGSVVKNRMDLFDPFFPNHRKGWWQKGEAYIHRKHLIDSLFGNENVCEYANIVKLFLREKYDIQSIVTEIKPVVKSKFKKMQETGLEAELYFVNNFQNIEIFKNGIIEDARLYGDGYDFQIEVRKNIFLAEVKGIRKNKGSFRLTENEYKKANEYKNEYIIILVMNLNENPRFLTFENPLKHLHFKEKIINSKKSVEYQLVGEVF